MLKKIFTNDKFFLATILCTVICEGFYTVVALALTKFASPSTWILLLRILCVVVLYISYKKYNKNVMKGMMGALLMGQVATTILYVSDPLLPSDSLYGCILLILSLLLFVNHFIINTNRQASPKMITINQTIIVVNAIINIVGNIPWIRLYSTPLIVAALIVEIPGIIGMNASIVCVESRLDAYRLDREAAGWTEEDGYPEGYVHQKDR